MKNKTLLKKFLKYSSLNVAGMIGLSCYILADTYFISLGLGSEGLAALNFAIPLYSLIHGIGLMLGMGGATNYTISRGRNRYKEANEYFTKSLVLAMAASVILVLLGIFFSENIAALLGAEGRVLEMTNIYLKVMLIFSPAYMLNNIFICFVRNDGSPRLSMIAMLTGSFSNIILDYIFIFPLGMGMFGAILATGIAPIVGMMVLSVHLLKKKNNFHLTRGGSLLALSKSIVALGVPTLVVELSSGIVMVAFNTIILKLRGNLGVAAYGIIANISLVVLSIYTGIAQGVQPILSESYGRGREEEGEIILKYALATSLLISVLIYALVFIGADSIAGIFNSEHNDLLQSMAVYGLRIYFIGCIFAGINIIMAVYFSSTAKPKPAQLISIFRGFILILPLSFILAMILEITGVWLAFPITELLVMVLVFRKKLLNQRRKAASVSL